jgi:hypothetical protein
MNLGIIDSGKVDGALGAWATSVGFNVALHLKTNAHAVRAAEIAGYCAKALDITTLIEASDLLLLTLPFGEIKNAFGSSVEHIHASYSYSDLPVRTPENIYQSHPDRSPDK